MKNYSKDEEFPPFIVDMIIRRVRIRHYHFKTNQERRREFLKERSWAECLKNNRSKLKRIHTERVLDKKKREVDLWKPWFLYQKKKLMKIYDSYTAWQTAEYKILERMNTRNFPKIHGSLWTAASIRQVQKMNRRVIEREIYDYNPKKFIKRQNRKLKVLYIRKPIDHEEESWNKCAIAASKKMNGKYAYIWEMTIDAQIRKLEKLYSKVSIGKSE